MRSLPEYPWKGDISRGKIPDRSTRGKGGTLNTSMSILTRILLVRKLRKINLKVTKVKAQNNYINCSIYLIYSFVVWYDFYFYQVLKRYISYSTKYIFYRSLFYFVTFVNEYNHNRIEETDTILINYHIYCNIILRKIN